MAVEKNLRVTMNFMKNIVFQLPSGTNIIYRSKLYVIQINNFEGLLVVSFQAE